METVLLTGFKPFDGFQANPSHQVVERLNGQTINGAQIVGLILPVAFGEDTRRVFAAIADLNPGMVLSLGLNAGATCLDVERFAVNRRVAERGGEAQEPIVPDGPAACLATIDVEQTAQAVRAVGVPARAHGYAGAYLCNHILYQTLHFAETQGLSLKLGFIHLPLSSEQAIAENRLGQPSLPLDTITAGVRAAIAAALAD